MFTKLKEKLKAWIKKSKDKIEDSAPKQEIKKTISKKEEKTLSKEKPLKKLDKDKIKPGKAETIEEKDSAEILSEKTPEEIAKITQQSSKEVKKDLKELKEEEIEKAGEKADAKIEEAKTQDIPETPQKYDVAKHKYEPDLEKLENEAISKEEKIPKKGFFQKIKSTFKYQITKEEFNEIFDDLEMLLLENNVALEVTEDMRKHLSENLIGKEIKKENLEKEIKKELKNSINEILIEPDDLLDIIKLKKEKPFVILFFGINGTGKTTSIAKLTHLLKGKNFKVVLAAGDTFRAASIEQIQIHADRLKVPLIKHDYGADPSAVGFDAIKYAKNHNADIVLIDTAGRMHTKTNLLQEMEKICRVTNPDLKIFVAESIAGNDATEQARNFNDMIEIDGTILSKADIDEKGGTIISVSHITNKPIFYLGVGQEYKDLKLFNKEEFIENLGLN